MMYEAKDGLIQNGNYYSRTPPPVCLLSVHLTSSHVTRSSRLSPSIFAYRKRSKTEGWKSLGTRLVEEHIFASVVLAKHGLRILGPKQVHAKQCSKAIQFGVYI